jgi:formyl-CoA transferase
VARELRVVRTGFKLNGEAPAVASPPPRLGEHTDGLLAELGYSAAEVAALKQQQAV